MNQQHSSSTPNNTKTKGWSAFTHNIARDSKLWLWILLLLFISRLVLVIQNRHNFDPNTSLKAYLQAFFTGFQFDLPVATLFVLPSFLLACLNLLFQTSKVANVLRSISTYLFTILWVIITVVTLGYFKQYHNQFDVHLLGIVYDDFEAIVKTIWHTYPVVKGSLAMIATCVLLIWIARRWIKAPYPFNSPPAPRRIISRIGVTLLLLVILALGLRGNTGRRPMQKKDAARTTDTVLNHCIINPFSSLKYAIDSHRELMAGDGLDVYLKKENILKAFQEYAGNKKIKTVDDAFLHTAKGHLGKKPRHIFLIVMESYDGWTMLPEHADWHISDQLKSLGNDGIYVQRFLPGSRSTMTSLATIISGLADAGVITNERSRPGNPPFATAIAPQMEKLGFETHFYYAGYASWQRIGDFVREQGFKNIHMATHMDKDSDPELNEWGVSDERLFSYIHDTFKKDKPTFNMIMTSSNHPPYSLDLKKAGCPLTSVPAAYKKEFEHAGANLKMLGHHWYSDKWMGHFVRKLSSEVPDCLFAITGDHWGRNFSGPRPTMFEKAIVPLVLYGPDVLPKDIDANNLTGSHYDLGATFIEMCADPGFKYYSIGRNILTTQPSDTAMSRFWFLGKDFITPANTKGDTQSLTGKKISPPSNLNKLIRHYNLTHGISWWRLRKGNKLPAPSK